jgi:hypothetical protein
LLNPGVREPVRKCVQGGRTIEAGLASIDRRRHVVQESRERLGLGSAQCDDRLRSGFKRPAGRRNVLECLKHPGGETPDFGCGHAVKIDVRHTETLQDRSKALSGGAPLCLQVDGGMQLLEVVRRCRGTALQEPS